MRVVVLALCLWLACAQAALRTSLKYEGHYYELHDGSAGNSLANCITLGSSLTSPGTTETGHPTCITSAGENTALRDAFDNEIGFDGYDEAFYLWATDTATEGQWVWACPSPESGLFSIDSTPQNGFYTDWGGSNPNNFAGQDYGFVDEDGWNDFDDGGWDNAYCFVEFNDYDECLDTPCNSGETCANTYGSFTCTGGGSGSGSGSGTGSGSGSGTGSGSDTDSDVGANPSGGGSGSGSANGSGAGGVVGAVLGGLVLCCCLGGLAFFALRSRGSSGFRKKESVADKINDGYSLPRGTSVSTPNGGAGGPGAAAAAAATGDEEAPPAIVVGNAAPLRAATTDKLATVKNVPISRIESTATRAGGITDDFDDALSDLLCDSTLVPITRIDSTNSSASLIGRRSLGKYEEQIAFVEEPYAGDSDDEVDSDGIVFEEEPFDG